MSKAQIAILLTIIVTLITVSAAFLVPVPPGNKPGDFYFNLTITLSTVLLYIGGSVVIILSFDTFTNQFRKAYTILFTGLTFWALAYLQLPVTVITGLNSVVISLITIPFILSAVLVFIGTRMLAKLFSVISLTTKWWFTLIVLIAISLLTAIAPHVPMDTNELEFDVANILVMMAVTIFGFGAYHVLLIKRQASIAFTNAFAWLCISMTILSVFAGLGSTITTLMVKPEDAQIIFLIAFLPSCVAAALFLRSAYSFSQIAESKDIQGQFVERDFFGKPKQKVDKEATERVSSIDIVTHTATLVSTRTAIAGLMDQVRYITSQLPLNPPLPLPSFAENSLKQIYLQIEQYLLTQEHVRKFTRGELRQDIAQKLHLTSQNSLTFWNTLT